MIKMKISSSWVNIILAINVPILPSFPLSFQWDLAQAGHKLMILLPQPPE
jgi:hypothetical protein